MTTSIVPIPQMEAPSPFTQHLDTNYVPTTEELEKLKVFIAEQQGAIDVIDAEIAELMRRRATRIQCAGKHRALASLVRRLPDDILLAIFFQSLALEEPWTLPRLPVVISRVCRRWRALALGTPLLWTAIDVLLPWEALEVRYRTVRLQDPLRRNTTEDYLIRCISHFRTYVAFVEGMTRAFIRRSSGCPLELRLTSDDIAEVPSSPRILNEWSALLDPLCKLMADPTTRWKSIDFNITVSAVSPISLRFLQIPVVSSGLGMRSANISLGTHSCNVHVPPARWNATLPRGEIDLHSAQLSALSARMTHGDMSRIRTPWGCLTTLDFGAPPSGSDFLPSEAHTILQLTPNLVDCQINLSFPFTLRIPPLKPLTLNNLKSLTVICCLPPRAFAEALFLPSLTKLVTTDAMCPLDRGSVLLWVQRHGPQLKELSFAHDSVTKEDLKSALEALPNIESLALAGNPTAPYNFNEVDLFNGLSPENADACPCPKLRAITCTFNKGGSEAKEKAIVNFIEKRRRPDRPSSIAWLDKATITFAVPPVWSVIQELKRRQVDVEGLLIHTAAL
jgi:hypothetical protein